MDRARPSRMPGWPRRTAPGRWRSAGRSGGTEACARRRSLRRAVVDTLAHFLAALEEGNILLIDGDLVAGARIAPFARGAALDREGTEAPQLDTIATGQCAADGVENGIDD